MEATHDEQFVINGVGQGVLSRTIACLFAHSFGEPIEFSGDRMRINGVPAKAGDDHRTAEEVHIAIGASDRSCEVVRNRTIHYNTVYERALRIG